MHCYYIKQHAKIDNKTFNEFFSTKELPILSINSIAIYTIKNKTNY